MAKLVWDAVGKRIYETGVDRAVLFPLSTSGTYETGVAWNGLTGYTESPSGGDANAKYADNIKYAVLRSTEEFGATIECFTFPPEFEPCDGRATPVTGVTIGQQTRKAFGFTCRTLIGNDVDGDDFGYKLHIIWNATANPAERGYSTVNESPDAVSFSYELETKPVSVTGYKPTACMTIDSTKVNASKLAVLEDALYGTSTANPHLPTPDQVIAMLR